MKTTLKNKDLVKTFFEIRSTAKGYCAFNIVTREPLKNKSGLSDFKNRPLCIDLVRSAVKKETPKTIQVIGSKWFDKVNGNTYFSSDVYFDNILVHECLYQYGYGSMYIQQAGHDLNERGLIHLKDHGNGLYESLSTYCDREGIELLTIECEVRLKDLKKESTLIDWTRVVFRKFKKQGDIIALFPDLIHKQHTEDIEIESYQHLGQHGAATYGYCMKLTEAASPEEYQALKNELESIGYALKIVKRA